MPNQNPTNSQNENINKERPTNEKPKRTYTKPNAGKPTTSNQQKPVGNKPEGATPAPRKPAPAKQVQGSKPVQQGNPTSKPNTTPSKPRPATTLGQGAGSVPINKAIQKDNQPLSQEKLTPPPRRTQRTQPHPKSKAKQTPLRIIPLGGLGEIGKNITYYEYQNEALLVDCGMAFPDEIQLGIDIVIPDFEYVLRNRQKIKGLYITHGHEDHIGAIPYLLKDFNVPVYATRLTISLIEGKLKEHGLLKRSKLHVVKAGNIIKQGKINVEFINVNHSIPDACALAIHTPVGVVIQTGDFKVDYTPISGDVIDLARFGELGSAGVLALLSDSTNAERPGATPSEKTVGNTFDKLFQGAATKRIIIASFASNVYRVQQIVDTAVRYGRKVAVTGRSMENVVARSMELGYLDMPEEAFIDLNEAEKLPSEKVVIVTTGSQGEPMSALTRMSRGEHRQITVGEDDCIIISATPIPGNEKSVGGVVNELMKTGADVVYERSNEVHVSGHACQDELKLILALTKPKYFIPVHGEYRQLRKHANLALSMGISENNIYFVNNGDVLEADSQQMRLADKVTAGEILVDGLGVGDVGSIVLRDRKHLSEDGLIVIMTTIERKTGKIIAGPDIISRGFVYVRESEDLIKQASDIARKSLEESVKTNTREWSTMRNRVRDDVSAYVWQSTKRSPMILPMIQEV